MWPCSGHWGSCREDGGAAACGHPAHAGRMWGAELKARGSPGAHAVQSGPSCRGSRDPLRFGDLLPLGGALIAGAAASTSCEERSPGASSGGPVAPMCAGPAQDPRGGPVTVECFHFSRVLLLSCFWLRWAFAAGWAFCDCGAWGLRSRRWVGCPLWRPLLLQSGGRCGAPASGDAAHGLSCLAACAIFLDQGLNRRPLCCKVDS